jgi:2-polyprenyl-3-methyl-5-hydroxy-6-metoxy-1,4-benzoquinol methylase
VLLVSLGHRSGLFDTLAGLPPTDSAGIAAAAGLDERYVREWLGGMVAGGVVEHDPESGTYRLPSERAAFLTRGAASDNLAVFAQYIPLLAGVEDDILRCFREGGGVPYGAYDRFHEVMAEDSGQSLLPVLIDQVLPFAPGLRERLTAGIDVLDVGCGQGRALRLLARTFPQSRFTGYDLCAEPIAAARAAAAAEGLTNVTFEQRDLTTFDVVGRWDLITAFDAIHDQARPDLVLAGIARHLREGGTFLMQDIDASRHVHENVAHPLGALLYAVSTMHCMTVSLAQGGMGLGAMWGRETALAMLAEAGFGAVEVARLPHDVQNCWFVARPTDSAR